MTSNRKWHSHVYASQTKQPTPHSVIDILGKEDGSPLQHTQMTSSIQTNSSFHGGINGNFFQRSQHFHNSSSSSSNYSPSVSSEVMDTNKSIIEQPLKYASCLQKTWGDSPSPDKVAPFRVPPPLDSLKLLVLNSTVVTSLNFVRSSNANETNLATALTDEVPPVIVYQVDQRSLNPNPVGASLKDQPTGREQPSGVEVYSCNECPYSSIHRKNLKQHSLVHTGEWPFKCAMCKKGFAYRYRLNTHMLIHTGERPFKCAICKNSYIQSKNLKIHMLKHTGERPFKCVICNKDFAQRYYLKTHMMIHSGERPFKCAICNKDFALRHYLKFHMLVHTGEWPFKCAICKKDFTDKQVLQTHMLIHARQKPFKCDVCSQTFQHEHSLVEHEHKFKHFLQTHAL